MVFLHPNVPATSRDLKLALINTQIDGLAGYRHFDEPTRTQIERDNALALFPRLRDA